jgi:hypothetical protein
MKHGTPIPITPPDDVLCLACGKYACRKYGRVNSARYDREARRYEHYHQSCLLNLTRPQREELHAWMIKQDLLGGPIESREVRSSKRFLRWFAEE